MKVKIVDVAREANVSVATVSRVVNNIPLVNEETRERVLEAIKKTGYKPNAIARSLKIQKTNTLGIMIPDITNPFYTEMVRGAEDVCGIYKYNIILSNTDFDPEKEKNSLDVLVEKQCDGIIYVGKHLTNDMRCELIDASSEIVLGCVPDETGKLSGVLIDNELASYDLTIKTIEAGHIHNAVFCDDYKDGYINIKRLEGIKRAYQEKGISFDENLVFYGNSSVLGGFHLMQDALQNGSTFTNVFCYNDQMALGAIRAVEDAGKKVPEDISVCGFNNYWVAEWTKPEITTISQPMYDIGAVATRMLIKMCEKEESETKTLYVPYDLKIRNSVKGMQ
ncbi:MAG: LacI family DNA-binding transcriptional regulator [Eubacteriaceae bacterium]|nr:LacI family DNA-binding transcriptional regulator [Eubacteriaceae bacterium]MDD4507705.1 LacI family DNA-binding transcriptional regulator [Eubacteriaceae bacterium]